MNLVFNKNLVMKHLLHVLVQQEMCAKNFENICKYFLRLGKNLWPDESNRDTWEYVVKRTFFLMAWNVKKS